MLLCCLLLLGFVNLHWWKSLGTPGWFLLASIASYLIISSGASLATDAELSIKDVLRQAFFFLVTLAAILGGRWLLERIRAETLLKWTLVILVASCAVVLASPLLRDMGVLPEYRHPYRMTGTFTDPNDAGFIACMTAVLALAFQSNGRQRPLACLALVLGCAAGLASFSFTAILVLGGMLILFLLLNIRRLRQDLLHTGLAVLCMAGVLVWLISGAPVVNTHQAWIDDSYEAKRVGDTITVYLVNNKPYRADDNPVNPWRWQLGRRPARRCQYARRRLLDQHRGRALTQLHPGGRRRGQVLARLRVLREERQDAPGSNGGHRPDTGSTRSDRDGFQRQSRFQLQQWEISIRTHALVGDGLQQGPGIAYRRSRLVSAHYMEGAPIGNQGTPSGVHNVYLMLAGEAGMIPLALYLLTLFFLMRLLWTVPKSLGRDSVVGWVIVMALYGLSYHHLLTMGATIS